MAATEEQLGSLVATLAAAPVEHVAVHSLVLDSSPRQIAQDVGHVRALAGVGDDLPPIVVHRATMRVIDGVHRVHACRYRGQRNVAARFFEGTNEDAFLLAVKLNVRHGMPLSLADRRAAAERLLVTHGSWSDRALAAVTGLSPKTIASIRGRSTAACPQSNTRIGRDGRARPLSTAAGRLKAYQMMQERPEATLREVATACGISLGTAHDVRRRLREGLDPVPTRNQLDTRQVSRRRTEPTGFCFDTARARLQAMSREPSLKCSQQGRALLHLLRMSVLERSRWAEMVAAVPPHWRGALADMARFCAAEWNQVVEEATASPEPRLISGDGA